MKQEKKKNMESLDRVLCFLLSDRVCFDATIYIQANKESISLINARIASSRLTEEGLLRERSLEFSNLVLELVGGIEAHAPRAGALPDNVVGVGNGAGNAFSPERHGGEAAERDAGVEGETDDVTHVHASLDRPSAQVKSRLSFVFDLDESAVGRSFRDGGAAFAHRGKCCPGRRLGDRGRCG